MNATLLERTLTAARRDAWVRGDLSYKLQAHQRPVYEKYRAWEALPTTSGAGKRRRIFVLDIGRQWGKTALVLLIKFEDALRRPGSRHTFATAYAKDISDILLPLADMFSEDAPDDLRPVYQQSKSGLSQGLFFPKNGPAKGSMIKLVGVDLHPRALRGRASDGMAFTEAGFVHDLNKTVMNVCYPQFQRRPHARMILESNAPDEIDHDFDVHFLPDAKERGAYAFGTIDDNTAMSPETRQEFIDAAGGRDHPDCQREYFGVRIRDPERAALPEFNAKRHVQHIEVPDYACAFNGQDPGLRDPFGLVWGYWHAELGKLVIQRSWAKSNAGNYEIAEVVKNTNAELWEGEIPLRYWDGQEEHYNPAMTVSDVDPRLQRELNVEHGLEVIAADKSRAANGGIGEARLFRLRDWFKNDMIAIEPGSGPLEAQCDQARWNEQRTDLTRHKVHGHWDCMKALGYLISRLNKWCNHDPRKPARLFVADPLGGTALQGLHARPQPSRHDGLKGAFGLGSVRKRG